MLPQGNLHLWTFISDTMMSVIQPISRYFLVTLKMCLIIFPKPQEKLHYSLKYPSLFPLLSFPWFEVLIKGLGGRGVFKFVNVTGGLRETAGARARACARVCVF